MKLTCATCGLTIESLIIDKMLAWNECYTRLTQHATKRHPEVIAALQVELTRETLNLSAYVTMNRLGIIPESEKYLNLVMDEMQKVIMNAAGFDEMEEGEEEEEKRDHGNLTPLEEVDPFFKDKEDDDFVIEETEKPELPEDKQVGPKDDGVTLDGLDSEKDIRGRVAS